MFVAVGVVAVAGSFSFYLVTFFSVLPLKGHHSKFVFYFLFFCFFNSKLFPINFLFN
ncbi:unnamed protein product [Meloidogyne enterolobii]|uniref:Uncharacterized protein n=1 Tax=Meloidogyne enterolobii TaxID=390850 RepID=A0ACB0Y1B3_MELEN